MILFLRGHIRNSFDDDKLYYLIKKIKILIPDIKIFIQTWNIIQSSVSWRKMNEINYSVSSEMIYNYFRDLEPNIIKILILDDTNIELIGDLTGNICNTKAPKKGWKNMWYGIYEGLKTIELYVDDKNIFINKNVINIRFDILTNFAALNEDFILNFIKKNITYSGNKMKVFSENTCFGIDNFFIGNIFNMLEFIEFLYFNLDIILEKYPYIFHQEFIFYYENNKYSYKSINTILNEKSIKTINKLNYEIPNKRITINKNYYVNNGYPCNSANIVSNELLIKTLKKVNCEMPNKRITINKNKIIFDFTKEKWSKFI